MVVALAALTRFLEQTVPAAAKGTAFAGVAAAIEFPVYAILLGLLGNVVLTRLGLRDRLAGGFRTEFFIKTGLVLLGASINFAVILTAAGPAILQALVLISVVFGFTWWLGGRLGLDDRLRALLSSACRSAASARRSRLPARCRRSASSWRTRRASWWCSPFRRSSCCPRPQRAGPLPAGRRGLDRRQHRHHGRGQRGGCARR